jgi:hypothetical protein
MIKDNLSAIIQDVLHERKTILDLAKTWNFPPYLLARNIVEATFQFSNRCTRSTGETKKSQLSDAFRDTRLLQQHALFPMYQAFIPNACSLIETQIQDAIDADPMYGLQSDKDRHTIGIEYEVVLEHYLKTMSRCTPAHR